VMRTIFSVMVLSPVEPHSGDRMSLTESYKRLGRPRGGMTAARDRLAAAATPDALGAVPARAAGTASEAGNGGAKPAILKFEAPVRRPRAPRHTFVRWNPTLPRRMSPREGIPTRWR